MSGVLCPRIKSFGEVSLRRRPVRDPYRVSTTCVDGTTVAVVGSTTFSLNDSLFSKRTRFDFEEEEIRLKVGDCLLVFPSNKVCKVVLTVCFCRQPFLWSTTRSLHLQYIKPQEEVLGHP